MKAWPKTLKIGRLKPKIPIIQGGMAIRISMWRLAAAVANEGGIGLIAATAIPAKELFHQVQMAKEATKVTGGIIGINIMNAVKPADFKANIEAAIEAGVDLVVVGAGMPRILPQIVDGRVPFAIIASAPKAALLAKKIGAAAIIVEGKEAGGHLADENLSTWEAVPEVVKALRNAGSEIPVIAAGGIRNGEDIKKILDPKYGADGVQIGSLFAVSEESNASDHWKEVCINARPEDIVLIDSPVGLKGRAVRNAFTEKILAGEIARVDDRHCIGCLGTHCKRNFCIRRALLSAQRSKGSENDNEALYFLGEPPITGFGRIVSVHEIVKTLTEQYTKVCAN